LNFNILQNKITRHSLPENKENRDLVVYYLSSHADLNNRSIGDKLNLSSSAIGKIIASFQRKIKNNKRLQKKMKFLDSHFQV